MAITVNSAFSEFLTNFVNLDPEDTKGARASRDWLMKQIEAIPEKRKEFPPLYTDVHIHYGSFARRTKIRELDDLDMIIGLKALGSTYLDSGGKIGITVPNGIALRNLCHDGSALLNSRRVINLFVDYLADVPQYANSDTKRNGSAAVLNLTSYPWSFDIVPGFFTAPEADGRTYYIIPDGQGHWMKTDPRIDQDRVPKINQRHDGNVLGPLRLIKYWNRRPTMPSMQSYLLECIILSYYESALYKASAYVDLEIPTLLAHISMAVLSPVYDPKRIQGDINTLSSDDRFVIAIRASADTKKANEARTLEGAGKQRESINKWGEIFGSDFPKYG